MDACRVHSYGSNSSLPPWKEGFKINPYNMCVANKKMKGTQITICWYVDDLKLSHMSLKTVEEIITKIEERYGKMTVTYGNKHT